MITNKISPFLNIQNFQKTTPYNQRAALYYEPDTFIRRASVHKKGGTKKKDDSKVCPFKTIPYKKAEQMLTQQNIEKVQEFLRENRQNMKPLLPADKNPAIKDAFEIEGKTYDARFSGGGGTKNTFQIEHDGKKYIIALLTYIDAPYLARDKWLDVLEFETKNTRKLRNKGLKTNDIFEIVPIKAGGVDFPAVLMKPYKEHSYAIADRKNYSYSNLLSVKELDMLSDERMAKMYSNIAKEIAMLVSMGIEPHYDCVNLCREKTENDDDNGVSPDIPILRKAAALGEFHLYLNDLDKNFDYKKPTEDEAREYIKAYTELAILALKESVDDNLRGWCDYFMYLPCNQNLADKIKEMVYREYQKIS